MFQNLKVFQSAIAMARHAGARQSLIAQNIANSDTPGYLAKDLPAFTVTAGETGRDFRPKASRPLHLNGRRDASVSSEITPESTRSVNGNGVTLETEMLKSVEATRDHGRAIAVYRSSLNILRASLGRS